VEERKQFFLEKKAEPALREPKTFMIIAPLSGKSRDSDIKVFCFFSSEKKAF
jgi:hypothetical protein